MLLGGTFRIIFRCSVLPDCPPSATVACFPPPVVWFYYFPSGLDVSITLSLPLAGEFASKSCQRGAFPGTAPRQWNRQQQQLRQAQSPARHQQQPLPARISTHFAQNRWGDHRENSSSLLFWFAIVDLIQPEPKGDEGVIPTPPLSPHPTLQRHPTSGQRRRTLDTED